MHFIDKETWDKGVAKNQDSYGGGVYHFAEQWANLMEDEISKGKALKEIAKEASHKADTEGITGFMYGCAVSILSKCWIHGEQLRIWHNLDTQLQNEGEEANEKGTVLNPALINVSEKK